MARLYPPGRSRRGIRLHPSIHCGIRETDLHGGVIDYLHLLKVGDDWSIVSKLWDAE